MGTINKEHFQQYVSQTSKPSISARVAELLEEKPDSDCFATLRQAVAEDPQTIRDMALARELGEQRIVTTFRRPHKSFFAAQETTGLVQER